MIVSVRTEATVRNGMVTEKVTMARIAEAEWVDEWLHIIWAGTRVYVAICESCGTAVSNQALVDLSYIRFRATLCRRCFDRAKQQ